MNVNIDTKLINVKKRFFFLTDSRTTANICRFPRFSYYFVDYDKLFCSNLEKLMKLAKKMTQ